MVSIPKLNIGDDWVDVNAATSIDVGAELAINVFSATGVVEFAESPTKPADNSTVGIRAPEVGRTTIITSGSDRIWIRSSIRAIVSIQRV